MDTLAELQTDLAKRLAGHRADARRPIRNTCNGTDTFSSQSIIPMMRWA